MWILAWIHVWRNLNAISISAPRNVILDRVKNVYMLVELYLLYLYLVTLNVHGDSLFVIISLYFLQVVEKTCRCGKKRKTIPCSQQMTCETKCSRTRNCGRHPCKKKVYFVKKMLEIYQCYQTSRNAWKIYEKVHGKQTLIRLKS